MRQREFANAAVASMSISTRLRPASSRQQSHFALVLFDSDELVDKIEWNGDGQLPSVGQSLEIEYRGEKFLVEVLCISGEEQLFLKIQ
jgi:hypothetical protein